MPKRQSPDTPGTPWYDINQKLEELKSTALRDPQQAVAQVKEIVDRHLADGNVKPIDAHRFKASLDSALESEMRGVIRGDAGAAVVKVILDWLLQAWGMGASKFEPRSRYEDIQIQTLANLMNEDGGIEIPREAKRLIQTANELGFPVVLLEQFATCPFGSSPVVGWQEPSAIVLGIEADMAAPQSPESPGSPESSEPPPSAIADLLAWAEANGCPPDICQRARQEIEGEESGDVVSSRFPEGPIQPVAPS